MSSPLGFDSFSPHLLGPSWPLLAPPGPSRPLSAPLGALTCNMYIRYL